MFQLELFMSGTSVMMIRYTSLLSFKTMFKTKVLQKIHKPGMKNNWNRITVGLLLWYFICLFLIFYIHKMRKSLFALELHDIIKLPHWRCFCWKGRCKKHQLQPTLLLPSSVITLHIVCFSFFCISRVVKCSANKNQSLTAGFSSNSWLLVEEAMMRLIMRSVEELRGNKHLHAKPWRTLK